MLHGLYEKCQVVFIWKGFPEVAIMVYRGITLMKIQVNQDSHESVVAFTSTLGGIESDK